VSFVVSRRGVAIPVSVPVSVSVSVSVPDL
jgi:hypothetical protein